MKHNINKFNKCPKCGSRLYVDFKLALPHLFIFCLGCSFRYGMADELLTIPEGMENKILDLPEPEENDKKAIIERCSLRFNKTLSEYIPNTDPMMDFLFMRYPFFQRLKFNVKSLLLLLQWKRNMRKQRQLESKAKPLFQPDNGEQG